MGQSIGIGVLQTSLLGANKNYWIIPLFCKILVSCKRQLKLFPTFITFPRQFTECICTPASWINCRLNKENLLSNLLCKPVKFEIHCMKKKCDSMVHDKSGKSFCGQIWYGQNKCKQLGEISITWRRVSAQVALLRGIFLLSFKEKEIVNHREHLVAGVNPSKETGTRMGTKRRGPACN